jgi:hypothetical protein
MMDLQLGVASPTLGRLIPANHRGGVLLPWRSSRFPRCVR